MSQEPAKKSIFSQALDALTDKDEKQALEVAKQQLAAAQAAAAKAAQDMTALKAAGATASAQASGQIAAATKRAQEAEAQVRQLQQQLNLIFQKQREAELKAKLEGEMKAQAEAAKPQFIKEHKLTKEETLSHLSLKYYGSATKPYWMLIYEANKDVIGENPNKVHEGMVLKIPVLPEEMKKKK